jgi:hypothetical protein
MEPSVSRLAGQLSYLFEDEPGLRGATPAALATRLNREDRYARARSRYPMATDAEIAEHVGEFEDRITEDDVRAALAQLTQDPYER